jgi:ADP-ribosylglycohydrolase
MTGRHLTTLPLPGMDIQINPGSPTKARIPGEDLVKAAGSSHPKALPAPAASSTTNGTQAPQPSAPASRPAPAPAQPPRPEPAPPAAATTGPATAAPITGPATAAPTGPRTANQPAPVPDPTGTDFGQRFLGSLLAGAVGDALGSAVEFYPVDQIRSRYGEGGVSDYDRTGERPGEFTDDTQMTLFTLEGLIRGHIATRIAGATSPLPAVQLAYQRWLHTQGYAWGRAVGPFADQHPEPTGWLIEQRDLFAVRSPNSACITALREFASVGAPATFERAINDSQDCGGVVRAAPVALWSDDPKEVFQLAAATAALTYSHPNGYLPAGVLAVLMHRLLRGESLPDALRRARALLVTFADHHETDQALQAAEDLANQGKPTPEQLKDTLGGGWAGHEALAISVCAALSTDGIAPAVMVAINHSGDSDSTGAICGNIVGAWYGTTSVPGVWLRDLKQRETLETLARDALVEFGPQPPTGGAWARKYPAEHDTSDLVFTSTLPQAPPKPAPEPERVQDEPERPASAESTESAHEAPAPAPVSGKPATDPSAPADRAGKVLGCLIGGAVGDALGLPIESDSLETIRAKYGQAGLTDFVDTDRRGGSISDSTQMTLFTSEGLIRASIRRRLYASHEPSLQVQHAYQRWLHTQGFDWKDAGGPIAQNQPDGWLIRHKGLFVRRAPGATSIQALHGYANGRKVGSFAEPVNDSKGCGGVMRAAPAGMWSEDPTEVFRVGAVTAALTHGHPSGFLPAGTLAVIVQQLLLARSLPEAVDRALTELSTWDGDEETTTSLRYAIELAATGRPTPEQLREHIGEGWVGDQALAIAVCAALSHPESFSDAVIFAANHSGNSDATAAICGNIMGATHAVGAIPQKWRSNLELRDVIEQLAYDSIWEFSPRPPEAPEWLVRYPVQETEPVTPAASPDQPETLVFERVRQDEELSTAQASELSDSDTSAEQSEPTPSEPVAAREYPEPASATETPEPVAAHEYSEPASATETPEPVAAHESPEPAQEIPEPIAASEGVSAEPDPAESTEESDDALSDEELRLLAAWRKFRDGPEDTPTDLSQGLHKLLVEAFGAERAAQLVGESSEQPADVEDAEQPAAEAPVQLTPAERHAGCVLGGAVGDALGAPWMFADLHTILADNPEGLRDFTEFLARRGTATAITQQTAFVLDGLLRTEIRSRLRGIAAHPPSMVLLTLQHWLCTQGSRFEPTLEPGELAESAVLRAQRFPDETSLTALSQWNGRREVPTADNPPNAARSVAATARGAIVGFHAPTSETAITLGAEVAAVTHGHPDGYLPAGAVAGLIASLLDGWTLEEGVHAVLSDLDAREGSDATAQGLRAGLELAQQGPVSPSELEELGTGWAAPEALAIAVAAALSHPNSFPDAVSLAATHSGNSAATAAICGSLVGAANGADAIPQPWQDELELREVLDPLLADSGRVGTEIFTDYPPPDWAKRYLT